MYNSFDVGPIGARLVGPIGLAAATATGFPRYAGAVPDEMLSKALEEVRKDLAAAPQNRRQIDPPPTRASGVVDAQLFGSLAGALVVPLGVAGRPPVVGAPANRQVFRYDPVLRDQLIVDALMARLVISRTGAQGSVMAPSHPGQALATLDRPTAPMISTERNAVLVAAQRRGAQRDEVLSQVDATPIFFTALLGVRSTTHPVTIELLSVVASVLSRVLHPIKHLLAVPRPDQLDGAPMIPQVETPPHFSFPAGHAAFGFGQAFVLALLFNKAALPDLFRLAQLVSDNRVVAGLHYPMDADGGLVVGAALGLWLAYLATADSTMLHSLSYAVANNQGTVSIAPIAPQAHVPCPEWSELVAQAAAEWA